MAPRLASEHVTVGLILPSCDLAPVLMHVTALQGEVSGSREVAEHAAGSSVKAMAAVQIDAGALTFWQKRISTHCHPGPPCAVYLIMVQEAHSLDGSQPETG